MDRVSGLSLRPTALTLASAVPGVIVFLWLGLPLPFLLGSMATVAVAGFWMTAGVANPVRDLALFLLGLEVGASMTPDAVQRLAGLPVTALCLALSTAASMAVGYIVYARLARWDRVTSFLAASPGALSTIIALTHDSPADMARVMLAQSVRLAALIAIFPLAFGLDAASAVDIAIWSPREAILATVLAALAGGVLRWRAVPAAWILGPAAAIASLTASGTIAGHPPPEAYRLGLFLIGAATGAKLVAGLATGWRASLALAMAGLCAMLAVTALFALVAHQLTGLPLDILMLAYAPGGFEAMIAMAIALDLDPALVSAAHVSRVLGLTLALPLIYRARG